MKFTEFGNDERYRRCKDVLKSILFDLYARVSDRRYKKNFKTNLQFLGAFCSPIIFHL